MREHRYRLILATLGLLAIPVFLLLRSDREPTFGGRTLSQWLDTHSLEEDGRIPPGPIPPEAAIRHVGTNAVPYLLKWIRYEQPRWKRTLYVQVYRVFKFSNRFPSQADPRKSRAEAAAWAFRVLGAKAEGAIPELNGIMNDPKTPQSSIHAARALAAIGTKDVLAPLLTVLTNRQHPARFMVAFELAYLGTNARPAIPALVQCLDNPMPLPRLAARSLGVLKLEPAIVVPALAKTLQDSNDVCLFATQVLEEFGPEAKFAVPALVNLLTNQNFTLRRGATNALLKIDSQALTNAIHH